MGGDEIGNKEGKGIVSGPFVTSTFNEMTDVQNMPLGLIFHALLPPEHNMF